MNNKLLLLSFLVPVALSASSNVILAPSTTTDLQVEKKADDSKDAPKKNPENINQVVASKEPSEGNQTIIITPDGRSGDIKSAIDFLSKKISNFKPGIQLTNGQIIANINQVDVMPNGTILILTYPTQKGDQYKVVTVESVESVTFNETPN